MTDNEIIKALDCCVFDQNCSKCPHYNNDKQTRECLEVSIKCALDLINRLQSQNKDLAETIHNLTLEKDALFDKAEELKVEVERLNALVKTKNKLIEGLDQSISYAYDRAIEEFAERLKEKSDSRFDYSELVFEISEGDIDNLVKEMVGEEK